ncbi:MAG TPA: amidohydrolase family protein, partial [Gemmatimonadales bacterium]|nr:amidohydrolase family protein [Gemmatimonadales bacterium]
DAPLAALLAARIRVGVGTDSVVSVGELDLLAEARAARALAGLDAAQALSLCTIGAARALGLESEIGGLRVGKWGDCAVIRCPMNGARRTPEELALASGPRDVAATYVGGRDVYRNSPPL